MSFWRIAELVADRRAAGAFADRVTALSQAGLLNEYEEKFLASISQHLASEPLTPRQASVLYTIWIERRPRDRSGGVSLKSVVKALDAISLDLDDDEEGVLKELLEIGAAAQLADINRAARLAVNHELDFQPIYRGWRVESDADERSVQALAGDHTRMQQRKPSKARGFSEMSEGSRSSGADLGPLLMALSSLEAAINQPTTPPKSAGGAL
ncbi:MAG: hypothetical protein ACK4JY_10825 [Brevundimonas sp.]|uniref:hypothetical protein n=1 Tax=Brevundimonas sp. TaxID=1871086 RepID=UPI00391AA391